VVKIGKLLINEPPLIILPTLAEIIGLNEAIVIQQIHYWLQKSNHVINGKRWVYNSYPEWQKQFPFWTERTIRRIMKSLTDQGLIFIDNFNESKSDKTNWYSINYAKLNLMMTSCPYDQDNLSLSIPETTTDKKKYASSVSLFKQEYNELIEKFGLEKGKEMIEILNNYKEAHGKNYKSDYHAILSWVVNEVNKKNNKVIDRNKEIVSRQREIAFNRWIEEGNDPDEFSY
jgi:hypothetical protein